GRNINKSEASAGHYLENEAEQRPAAENIEPAFGACGYLMPSGRGVQLAHVQSVINPQRDLSQHIGSSTNLVQSGSARVGRTPPRTRSSPFSILYSYSYSPRGGGP